SVLPSPQVSVSAPMVPALQRRRRPSHANTSSAPITTNHGASAGKSSDGSNCSRDTCSSTSAGSAMSSTQKLIAAGVPSGTWSQRAAAKPSSRQTTRRMKALTSLRVRRRTVLCRALRLNAADNEQRCEAPMAASKILMRSTMLLLTLAATGCATVRQTDPPTTAEEQLLVSMAVDRAVGKLTLPGVPAGSRLFVDVTNVDVDQNGTVMLLPKYTIAAVRDQLLRLGYKLVDDRKVADYVVELRNGGQAI